MFDWKWSGLVRVFFRIFFRATWDRKWPAHRAEWTPRSSQFGTSSKRGLVWWELWFPDLATQAVWCLPCFQTSACLMLLRSTPIAKWPGKRNSQRTSLQNWQNPAIDFRSVLDRFILRSIGFTQGEGIAHHCPLCGAPTLTYRCTCQIPSNVLPTSPAAPHPVIKSFVLKLLGNWTMTALKKKRVNKWGEYDTILYK